MMVHSRRKEPMIPFGAGEAAAKPMTRQIERAPREAPTGDLTRAIRKKHAQAKFDALSRALKLSKGAFDAITDGLLADGGSVLGDNAIRGAMRAVFDCEPIAPTTPHPLMLVGGHQSERMRAALALSQRMEWSGRRVALYSMQQGRFSQPEAVYAGGLDILNIGSVDACIDAVKTREPGELAVIDASCLDGGFRSAATMPELTLALNAEAVYVDDGYTDLPEDALLSGIERVILTGRPQPERFGMVLNAAYGRGWAFAGQCSVAGIYHPMTPDMLADRFALSVY